MSIEEIIAHEERLNNIAFEAKATKEGVSKVKRERESRLTLAEKERLHSKDLEHNVSESLRTVEKRKTRITGKDQLNKDLVSMGLVGDDLKEILSQVTVTGKKKKLEAIKPAAKFVFNGTPKPLDDNGNPEVEKRIGQSINQPVPQVPNLNTDSELPTKTIFDPTKLFGKKD
jgi:phosphoenolpyruvate carboxylase